MHSKRDPWDFSDRMDGHIDGSANYNMLKEQQEELLQRERERLERPLLAEIDALRLENRGLTQQKAEFFAEFERLRTERDDANKIASDAKFEIDRLVIEVHRLRDEIRRFAETCICPACKNCQ